MATQTPDILRSTSLGFAPKDNVIVAGINELESSFCDLYLTVLVPTKSTIHLLCYGYVRQLRSVLWKFHR